VTTTDDKGSVEFVTVVAIQSNCAVPTELPQAVQDLADLLVELALNELTGDETSI
jgi:hypothetical protein